MAQPPFSGDAAATEALEAAAAPEREQAAAQTAL